MRNCHPRQANKTSGGGGGGGGAANETTTNTNTNTNGTTPRLTSLGRTKQPVAARLLQKNTEQEDDDDSRLSSPPPLLCRFYVLQKGNCRYGDDCAYSHDLPDGVSWESAKKLVPCPFFARGNCRYGNFCQLRHDSGGDDCDDYAEDFGACKPCAMVPSLAGSSSSNNSSSTSSSNGDELQQQQEEVITCGICLEDLQGGSENRSKKKNKTKKKKQFGLLSCCNHAFCFDCLMEWRKQGTDEASDRRSCPTCRKHSDYVVPSRIFPSGPEHKESLVRDYKKRLVVIPCRRFQQTKRMGSCPFGSDCFYAHINASGENVKGSDKSMAELSRERQQAQDERRHRRQRDFRNSLLGLAESTVEDIDIMLSFLRLLDLYGYQSVEEVVRWSDDADVEDYDDDHSDYTENHAPPAFYPPDLFVYSQIHDFESENDEDADDEEDFDNVD